MGFERSAASGGAFEGIEPDERSAAWGGAFASEGIEPEDEQALRRSFWAKAKRVAAGLPFAEDLLTAYYCAFDRATPLQAKATLLGAIAYFVLPFDAVPDMLPLVGFTDDAAVITLAIRAVMGNIQPDHREAARRALERELRAA